MSHHHNDSFSCLLRQRLLSGSTTGFQRAVFSCLLLLLLLAQMLGNGVFVVPHALAAGKPVDVPASFTARQFLHLTNKPVHFGKPLFYPPVPKTRGPSTDYAHLPPSSEPATMTTRNMPSTARANTCSPASPLLSTRMARPTGCLP